MGVKWTNEQQKVIDLRNRNILVSAAAGSGKTAVLVERIIQMLTDPANPVDVDRLLIVTFTEAAAAEMKERIREAIEKSLEDHPENVHLQRQATLIHSALITTIHSFCLSIIRDHFHVLDIDPGFRIAEEGELKLLKQDVLDELLEERYAQGEIAFLEFVEKFGTGRNDKKIEEIIFRLYEYSRSYPQPDVWLENCAQGYRTEEEDLEDSACMRRVKELARQKAQDMLSLLEDALALCDMPDGPYMYGDMLEADREVTARIAGAGTFEEMYQAVNGISWKRLSTKKDESVDVDKREKVKALREKVKKMAKDMTAMYFYEEPQEIMQDMAEAADSMSVLSGLVKEFADHFSEKKQSKNMIDFSDMEQFALKILTVEEDGVLVPSPVAGEYQEQFAEVMIDEYQDSNLIQEAILTSVSTVSRGKNNVFMVGDVKQSIYRFRLSRPELFMEKYDTYSQEDSDRQRIDLHKNFRSREEVLSSVNFIFEHIMRKELGGILYDDQAALYPGAAYEPQTDDQGNTINQAELLLVDTSADQIPEDVRGNTAEDSGNSSAGKRNADQETDGHDLIEGTGRQIEARAVAKRIKELMQSGRVLDKASGNYRAPMYKDIVILTRSIKGWADVFAEVLGDEGIPAYAGSREGYFETYEVSILLDYLQILDNFRQELPLTAVLTSPFAGLNAQQLADIRNTFPEIPFYDAVSRYAGENSGEKSDEDVAGGAGKDIADEADQDTDSPDINKALDPEIRSTLRQFLSVYRKFRESVPYTAIHELLWHIIEETGYGIYISAMPGGAQRMANVEMLVEKASAFEGTSYKGLFNFVRYIEQLQKYDVDYGEANIADEQSDTVRIMTIHKSKGLEFPIVFVAGMGKQFNTQDTKGSIVIHPEWGVGIDSIDLERRTKIPTILKKVIQEEITRENLGEELRVLYVALTRAKEKLIMTAQLPHAEEVLEKSAAGAASAMKAQALPYYILAGARSYLDWLLPLVGLITKEIPLEVRIEDCWNLSVNESAGRKAEEIAKDVLLHWDTRKVYHEQLGTQLKEQLGYTYPYELEGRLKLKFTVSELKKRAYLEEESGEELYEETEVIPLLPEFLKEESELTGASRGSAYHRLLELLDFRQQYNEETLLNEIERFTKEGRLSEDMAECIRTEDILGFLNCKSGQRMHKSAVRDLLRKEQPFVLGVKATEIYPEEQSDETILVQGIIDVYFEEEGELIVLDYKTDKVRSAAELKEKYHAQLDYYAQALEQLLGKKVKEKIIYSFTLKEEIQV